MLKIYATEFEDVKIIENTYQFDIRGKFVKIFNKSQFSELGLNEELREIYYSTSQKDVIRGMHFQMPPFEHEKIVHIIKGGVVDVLVDLRKSSQNYKKYLEIHLSGNKPKSIYIPKGFAHGFKCLEDGTEMIYQVTSEYEPNSDTGIAFDSIGYDWGVQEPIISERDRNFIGLNEFISPF